MRLKKLKKKQIKFISISVLIILSNTTTYALMQYKASSMEDMYENVINNKLEDSNNIKKMLYVPTRNIQKGEFLSKEDFEQREVKTELSEESFIEFTDDNMFATVDLNANEPVTNNMVNNYEILDSDRIEQFNMLLLQSDLKKSDTVDVRIFFPNGENQIVLSKKKILDLDNENNIIWLKLNEEEIGYMSSAVIDSYTAGSKLYVNKYVDSNIQESALPTYTPNLEILLQVKNNPNILDELKNLDYEKAGNDRLKLEERLEALDEEEISNVEQGVEIEETISKDLLGQVGHMNVEDSESAE